MCDSQPIDECENDDIFIPVVHLGQLTLEVVNVRLETIEGSHLDGREAVVVLLELLKGEKYCERNNLKDPKSCGSIVVEESRTNQKLLPLNWKGKASTI